MNHSEAIKILEDMEGDFPSAIEFLQQEKKFGNLSQDQACAESIRAILNAFNCTMINEISLNKEILNQVIDLMRKEPEKDFKIEIKTDNFKIIPRGE